MHSLKIGIGKAGVGVLPIGGGTLGAIVLEDYKFLIDMTECHSSIYMRISV